MNHFNDDVLQGVAISPHKWVPITPITPLFERAIYLYNSHHSEILKKKRKSLENFAIFF